MAYEKRAGGLSSQVKWFDPTLEGNARFREDEFERDSPEVMALIEHLLHEGVTEQVSVVTWVHNSNLPNALPPIRSSCSSLTSYKLVDGKVEETPHNIF